MNTAQGTAIEFNVPVLVFSLEISKSRWSSVSCTEARVDSTAARRLPRAKRLDQHHQGGEPDLGRRSGSTTAAPRRYRDPRQVRRWRSDSNIFTATTQHGMIVIDYLQLIHGRPAGGAEPRAQISGSAAG
jgi:replicative DNA helicase